MTRKFEAIISILDRASAPLLAIEDKMRNLGGAAKKTEVEIKEIGATSLLHARIGQDIHAIGAKLHGIGASIHHHLGGPLEKVEHVMGKLIETVPILGSALGAISLGGALEMIHHTAEASEQLTNLATISGESVAKLQRLQFATHDAGVSTDALARGLGRLNERLGKAATGQNKQLASLFQHLHISLRNANGTVKDASQQLPLLMQAFHDTHDKALRAQIAMLAFGRSGVDLIPILKLGTARMDELNARFTKYGETLSPGAQAGLEKYTHAWNDLELAVGSFVTRLDVDLAPALAPILKQMAVFVAQNRGLISADLKSGLKWLEKTIENFHWAKFEKNAGAAFKVIVGGAEAAARVATDLDHLINGNAPVAAHVTVGMANVRNPFAHVPTKPYNLPSLPSLPHERAMPPGTKMIRHGGSTPAFPDPGKPAANGRTALIDQSRSPGRAPAAAPHAQAPHKVALTLHITAPPGVTVTPKSVVGATVPRASLGHNGTVMELHTP